MTKRSMPAACSVAALLAFALLSPAPAGAQRPGPGRPVPYSFVLDLAGTPVGEIPTAIKQTKGIMEVVIKDGAPMLKASASSEFLITLPQGQVLPPDFTVEFEIVPKACCNPQDLSFEGTPTINQGSGSANILWDSDGYLAIIGGGGQNYEAPMPEDFRTTLPGVLTSVVAVFQGPTIRLYTNGRRMYTLDKQFARGRVLRVFLGGQDDGLHAVHLAGLRIAAGVRPPTGVPGISVPPPGSAQPAGPSTPQPAVPPPGQPAATPGAPPGTPAPVTPVLVNPPTGSITPMAPPPPAPVTQTPVLVTPPTGSITPMAPPAAPTITAPTGVTPRTAGASSIVPMGPASLTVANRSGWGATLQWAEVVNATGYQIDRSESGGAFVLFAGVDAKFSPPVSGFHSSEDVTVWPGIRYDYRVKALFATGPAYSSFSPSAGYDTPNQLPMPANLTATMSTPFKVTPTSTAPPLRTVTWDWLAIPGALTYEAEISLIDVLPSSAQQVIGVSRVTLPANATPPYSSSVETGKRVQFCLSLIRPTATKPYRYGSCRITDVVP